MKIWSLLRIGNAICVKTSVESNPGFLFLRCKLLILNHTCSSNVCDLLNQFYRFTVVMHLLFVLYHLSLRFGLISIASYLSKEKLLLKKMKSSAKLVWKKLLLPRKQIPPNRKQTPLLSKFIFEGLWIGWGKNRSICVVVKGVTIVAGGFGLYFRAGQITQSRQRRLTTAAIFLQSCIVQALSHGGGPATRYTLRRYTTGIMKIWFDVGKYNWDLGPNLLSENISLLIISCVYHILQSWFG